MAIDHPYWDQQGRYIEPLVQLVRELKPKTILEIGLGQWAFSTHAWLEESDAKVTTVDKGDWNGYAPKLAEAYPGRFTFKQGLTDEVLPKLKQKYDLIFIDGDHAYEGCKNDILNCQKLLAPNGVILMDDYGVDYSAVDVNDNGDPIDGHFGVKQACDECFENWKQVYQHINFANGGRAYALKPGKR